MANLPTNSLTILDVGHGNSAVVIQPEGTVVIDAGIGPTLLDFLTQNDIAHISTIIISHADKDHIGGLVGILSSGEFTFSDIFLNTDSDKESSAWDDLLYELDILHAAGRIAFNVSLTAGDEVPPDLGDTKISILSPNRYLTGKGPGSRDRKKRRITSNSISGVILISRHENPIALLCGDMDRIGLDGIIESRVSAHARYLVFPHHGGNPGNDDISGFSKDVFQLTSPEVLIFSIGRGRYDTPNPIIIDIAKSQLPDITILCTQLSERCHSVMPLERSEFHSNYSSRGYEESKCCAGTVVINLDQPADYLPENKKHQEYIANCVATPICHDHKTH